tara:strand:- start:154 stop:339 length:186 start_codon:yes stop_codon:yes gene_type:complete
MSINSEIDRIANEVVLQVYEEINNISSKELEYSDLDIEGDEFYELNAALVELVYEKIKNEN